MTDEFGLLYTDPRYTGEGRMNAATQLTDTS